MRTRLFSITILILITILPIKAFTQGVKRIHNTQSNLDFFATNNGVLFNNGAIAGLNWPRGTVNSYIFGGGLWFAAKKYFPGSFGSINQWSSVGAINDSVVCIAANPSTRTFFVGSLPGFGISNGLYLRSDAQKSWANLNLLKRMAVTSVVTLPNAQELIGADSGLFIGASGGPWTRIISKEKVIALSNYGVAATIVKNTPTNIYTPDPNGVSWTLRHSFSGNLRFSSISSISGNVFIVASSAYQIWISQDTGTSWTQIPVPGTSNIVGVSCSSVDNSIFAATSGNGVFQSFDLGNTWVPHNSGLSDLHCTVLKSSDGKTFGVGTKSGVFILLYGVQKNGAWIDRSSGIPGNTSVFAMDIDAFGDIHLILSDKRIVTTWKSTELKPGWFEVCEMTYNPNTGNGWFAPGEPDNIPDINGKNYPYLSTSFDHIIGEPIITDSVTPQYAWPIWESFHKTKKNKQNFNFGTWISNINSRDSAAAGADPVFISQEDILNSYSDDDSTMNPEFTSGLGYPLGLHIHESIYSWGFGRYRDLIFIRYEVRNSSKKDTLKDCFLAPASDPDLGVGGSGGTNDLNSYFGLTPQDTLDCLNFFPESSPFHGDPTALNLARQWSRTESTAVPKGEYGCIGFAFVETPVAISDELINNDDSLRLGGYGPNSLYQKNRLGLSTFRQWTISNDPVASTRYDFAASGRKDFGNTTNADMRLLMSTGPFTLAPGRSVTTTIAIGIARPSTTVLKDNQDSLVKLMAFAHDFFAHPVSEFGDPNSIAIHHFEGAPTSSVRQSHALPPINFTLSPNPASGDISINYLLEKRSSMRIEILNLLGQSILELSDIQDAGAYTKYVDLSKQLSGSYFARLVIDGIATMKSFKLLH